MKIGDRLKILRKEHLNGIPQDKFADRIGTTGAAISRYESSDRAIPNPIILSICREFNVNRCWLETGEGKPFVDAQSETLDKIAKRYNSDGNDTFRAILDVYAQLDSAEQEAFESFVRKFMYSFNSRQSNNSGSAKFPAPELGDPTINRLIRDGAIGSDHLVQENKAN